MKQIPLVNGPKSAGRERAEGGVVVVGYRVPARENTAGILLHCPVGNGLVPAEIVPVPLLQPHRIKAKSLTFTISGEGHLPWVRVLCLSLCNVERTLCCASRGTCWVIQRNSLVLCNDGIIPVHGRTCSGNVLVWESVLVL